VASAWQVSRIDLRSGARETRPTPAEIEPAPGSYTSWHFTFSPDGTKLFASAEWRTPFLVDGLTGRARRYPHAAPSGRVRAVFPTNETMLVADGRGAAYVDWESLRKQPLPVGAGTYYPFDARGDRIAYADYRSVNVVDGRTSQALARLRISGAVQLALSPDGTRVAVRERAGVRVLDVESGAVLWADKNDRVGGFAWSPDGRRLAACDPTWVYVWSFEERPWVSRFPAGDPRAVSFGSSVAFGPDSRALAAILDSSAVAYWEDVERAIRDPGTAVDR
jgi:WD40 repeat protein